MLSFRQPDHEAVEGVGQRDLAGESRIVCALRHAVEHFLLGRRARSYPGAPIRITGTRFSVAARINVVPEGTSTVCVPPPKPLKVTLGMQNL
jgi:hypothetical protein